MTLLTQAERQRRQRRRSSGEQGRPRVGVSSRLNMSIVNHPTAIPVIDDDVMAEWAPGKPLVDEDGPDYAHGNVVAYADKEDEVRLSVVLQYYRMPDNIPALLQWKRCKGVELLVNSDSNFDGDLNWTKSHDGLRADFVAYQNNTHELRSYNKLARVARGQMIAFVQDDAGPPASCDYVDHLSTMFNTDVKLAIVGMNIVTNTPWGYADMLLGLQHRRYSSTRQKWAYDARVAAEYVSCADIGPMVVRRDAFASLGSFDEGFSYPGQGGIGLDFDLSTRAWLAGGRVALYDLVGSTGKGNRRLPKMPLPEGSMSTASQRTKASYSDKDARVTRYVSSRFDKYRPYYHDIVLAVVAANETPKDRA